MSGVESEGSTSVDELINKSMGLNEDIEEPSFFAKLPMSPSSVKNHLVLDYTRNDTDTDTTGPPDFLSDTDTASSGQDHPLFDFCFLDKHKGTISVFQ